MKLKDRRLCFIDTETTGLDPFVHEMIEFAAVFQDGTVGQGFRIKPQHIETASPKALEVNGYKPEDWKDALAPLDAAERIGKLLDNCILVGHNVGFDIGFIKALLKREEIDAWIDHRHIDTSVLAMEHLPLCGLESASLHNVCVFLGIEPEQATHRAEPARHRALRVYNALCRAGWWKRLWWRWRNRKG